MNIKIQEIEIPENDPFKYDKLKRKKSVKNIEKFIASLNELPFVLSVDSEFGMGKTIFLKMLKYDLINKEYCTIYFNAWENDLYDDIFISLILEISNKIALYLEDSNDKKILHELKVKSKKVLLNIISVSTKGIISPDIFTKEENTVEEEFKKYVEMKNEFNKFKNVLSKVADSVYNKTEKPLILIVDELDRCKPTYAIRILEIIKHLFSINNIVFILGIDKEQLGHSIKSVYGRDMKVDGYLSRFIDYYYQLPEPDYDIFVEYMIDKYKINEESQNVTYKAPDEIKELIDCTKYLLKKHKFSLRNINNYFIHLTSCMIFKDNYLYPLLLVILLIKRFENYNEYKNIITAGGITQKLQNELYELGDKLSNLGIAYYYYFRETTPESRRQAIIDNMMLLEHRYDKVKKTFNVFNYLHELIELSFQFRKSEENDDIIRK